MTEEQRSTIDSMSQKDMCRRWRFAKAGDPLFQGDTGEYFKKMLGIRGGFTTAISKEIGW